MRNSTLLLVTGIALTVLSWITSVTDLAPTIFICSGFIVHAIEDK